MMKWHVEGAAGLTDSEGVGEIVYFDFFPLRRRKVFDGRGQIVSYTLQTPSFCRTAHTIGDVVEDQGFPFGIVSAVHMDGSVDIVAGEKTSP